MFFGLLGRLMIKFLFLILAFWRDRIVVGIYFKLVICISFLKLGSIFWYIFFVVFGVMFFKVGFVLFVVMIRLYWYLLYILMSDFLIKFFLLVIIL